MVKGTDNAARVLVLLRDGAEAELTSGVLTAAGFNAWVAPDSGALCEQIGHDPMAVVTSEEALVGIMTSIQSTLAKQPPWSDLPLVIFTSAADQTEARLRLQQGLGPSANVLLLDRPVKDGALMGVMQAARRARLRQFEARHQTTRLAVLADASRLIASLDGEEVLQSLVQLVVPRLADWCAVDLVDGGSRRLAALAHVNAATAEGARERLRQGTALDRREAGAVLRVTHSGSPELLQEVTDARLEQIASSELHARILRELGMRSAVIVPL